MRSFAYLLALILLSLAPRAFAAPGAHGPDGEHLDGPAASAAVASDGRPRMESFSELFELVAYLDHDAVTAMINIYETNAPVDGAAVELESGGTTVKAEFDPTTGVYRFADPAMAEALNKPGKHSLAFTIDAGNDFDIVAGALDVADASHVHAHAGGVLRWIAWSAALLLAVVVVVTILRRRRRGGVRLAGARA